MWGANPLYNNVVSKFLIYLNAENKIELVAYTFEILSCKYYNDVIYGILCDHEVLLDFTEHCFKRPC